MSDIAVVITCHTPYLKWLPDVIASIDRQRPEAAESVVVFDGCDALPLDDSRWRSIRGTWGDPSPARNAALAAIAAPWIVFWDADNVMPDGYLAGMQQAIDAAPPDCAIIYPDFQYFDEQWAPVGSWTMPEWDYWELRAQNYINTSSAWRRAALEIVGGWADSGVEDYVLALDITARGWQARRLSAPPTAQRMHGSSRSVAGARDGTVLTDLWRARSMAILLQLDGQQRNLQWWEDYLLNTELPPRTALYLVDMCGSPAFREGVLDMGRRVADARELTHLDYVAAMPPDRSVPAGAEGHKQRIAALYASLLPRVAEDMVLTLDASLAPPLDAPALLGEQIAFPGLGRIGAVAAAYPLIENQNYVCAGVDDEAGTGMSWKELPDEPFEVAWAGAGCTIWANWALRGSPIGIAPYSERGWDTAQCNQLRHKGYQIKVHGGVRCKRLLAGP